ncbi:glycosyltransferase family 39 protein [Aquisphaera giovannonii]|uniref:glycosyltransferase family 39 protein n=1 Tax=Aquisphaera giovannonii TaxID=406548 RepID=UPI001FE2F9B4|nr:glycosyltransferase family 39 protein [Aquisphaera giovannonii]
MASFCLALMLTTEPYLVIVWDEGYTLGREERIRQWFAAMGRPASYASGWRPPYEELVPPNRLIAPRPEEMDSRAKLLRPPAIDWFWPFAREEPDGHPPVYALVGLAGDILTPWREPLPKARLGPMLVFSLTCGAIFAFLRRRFGSWAAAAAAGAWMAQPHLFALAHYATYDGLLTSFWTLACLSFVKAIEVEPGRPGERPRPGWILAFAALIALAMGTKFTGWLLPVPFLAWSAVARSRGGALTLLAGCVLAIPLLVLLVPPWWHDPILGVDRFLRSNLTRAQTTPLKTLFLGRIYDTPGESLPWYNTIVWTVLATPAGFLILAVAGVAWTLARERRDAVGTLFVIHWAFLLALRALPHTPGHDGVRQFLPAFGILAVLVGLGAGWVVGRLGWVGGLLIVVAVVEGGVTVGVMIPVPLSYFNPVFGGLPGAVRMGMEPTYYWDALQPEVLDWLNEHSPPGRKVRFARYPTSWLYLRRTGGLRPGILPSDPGDFAWYVVQNRPGDLSPLDRHLIAHAAPAKVYGRFGVPLIWVFPYDEVLKWQAIGEGRATAEGGAGSGGG